jgi:2-polyprenyl-6-methoxyphenol hydroxylase-like FAD-dependent oxidoreductase
MSALAERFNSRVRVEKRMKILVVGAGIAGLALAKAFEQRDIVVDIVERQADVQTAGMGFYLPGNATRALKQLGLLPEVQSKAVVIRRQVILDSRARPLSDIQVDDVWSKTGACMSMPRGELHGILRRSLQRTRIRHGKSVTDIMQPSPDGCEVIFDDGTVEHHDLVIGADGINSKVRAAVLSGEAPRYTGNVCWRFITANTIGIDCWTVMLGNGRTLLAIPVSASDVYVYADMAVAEDESRSIAATASLSSLFAGFDGPLLPLLDGATPHSGIHFDRIEQVRLGKWVDGRVVAIGDAAHACSPSMAEGAGMAMEDALVLAEEIAASTDLAVALERYEQRRRKRVDWVQDQSVARDKLRALPGFARSTIMKLFGAAMYRRGYRPLLGPM